MSYLKEIIKFFTELLVLPLRNNSSLFARYIVKKIYGTDCGIDTGVVIVNPKNFYAQKGSHLYHSCYILNHNGHVALGSQSHLGAFCYINANYGKVRIGDHVAIGPGTKIFSYSNHYEKSKKVTDTTITSDVMIGNNVFIGANCIILPGTIIQDHVVVGAGALIRGTLLSNSIYAGNPLKEIKNNWYQ